MRSSSISRRISSLSIRPARKASLIHLHGLAQFDLILQKFPFLTKRRRATDFKRASAPAYIYANKRQKRYEHTYMKTLHPFLAYGTLEKPLFPTSRQVAAKGRAQRPFLSWFIPSRQRESKTREIASDLYTLERVEALAMTKRGTARDCDDLSYCHCDPCRG